uniref:Uncharacterized protein n=1 Tax=Anguilla anguilla TaxID=7936 RepID=A0A0E9Y072_ANGAN
MYSTGKRKKKGRTRTIICTRTYAPNYISRSHRLNFGSICDQNGRNFEPLTKMLNDSNVSVWCLFVLERHHMF